MLIENDFKHERLSVVIELLFVLLLFYFIFEKSVRIVLRLILRYLLGPVFV